MATQLLGILRHRRRELGLSFPQLAARSGVAESTLKRMLGGHRSDASLDNVCAVAKAMGVAVHVEPEETATDYREKVAQHKARAIVGIVQGTSALESQAVPASAVAEMVKKTTYELVAGPNRRLWSP